MVIKRIEALAGRYILLDSLLFTIALERETAVLAVPETCIDKKITLNHSSLFVGHQGVICPLCQLVCIEKLPHRQLQTKINPMCHVWISQGS